MPVKTTAKLNKLTARVRKIEAALHLPSPQLKRKSKPRSGSAAFDVRQKQGPFLSNTFEHVLQAGLRTGALDPGTAQKYRSAIQHESPAGKVAMRNKLRKDMELHGVRFVD